VIGSTVETNPWHVAQAKNGEQVPSALLFFGASCLDTRSSWQLSKMQQGVNAAMATTKMSTNATNFFTVRR
jgi:hypothetical protein